MTKTVESVTTSIPTPKDIVKSEQVKEGHSSRASSESPPLVLKYLETLPPEKEVTLLVEVVQGQAPVSNTADAKVDFKAPKIIAAAAPALGPASADHDVASIVKAEIKEEDQEDLDEDEDEEEEDECFRIIEETVVDASTLPGRKF